MRVALVIATVLLAFLACGVSGSRMGKLHRSSGAMEVHVGAEALGNTGGDFVPPRTRLCVMYNYDLKHDDDSSYPEHQYDSVGQLPDGTTYGKDLYNWGEKSQGYAPCVLVNLEGDLVNTRGEVKSKFKLGGWYPTPPCLGLIKTSLLGATVNSAGHKCTPVADGDKAWINRKLQWYAKPQDIPPQAALQKPVNTLAPPALPRQRVCVLYNYALKHDDDSPFPEYYNDEDGSIGTLPDGTNWGRDNRGNGKDPPRYSRCTLVNLEGDIVDVKGKPISKFKLGGDYPTPPCLGSVRNGFLGGYKNIVGHSCTLPVGADRAWTDWDRAQWFPSPQAIPLLKK